MSIVSTAGRDYLYNAGSVGAVTGAFMYDATSSVTVPNIGVSPTAYGVANNFTIWPMFQSNAVTHIAQFFRRFRFRRLNMIYSTALGSSTNSNIQVSYEKDFWTAYQLATTTASQSTVQGQLATRLPCWEPYRVIPLIEPCRHAMDDDLFYTTVSGDALTLLTTATATGNQYFQGAVSSVVSGYITTTATTLGVWMWEFELDLYGLSPYAGLNIAALEEKKAAEIRALSRSRFVDEKDDRKCDDFIELAPIDRYRSVEETPPPTPVQRTAGGRGAATAVDRPSSGSRK
jgi:hypothetical protein